MTSIVKEPSKNFTSVPVYFDERVQPVGRHLLIYSVILGLTWDLPMLCPNKPLLLHPHNLMELLQTITHYSLHLLAPAGIAYLFFRENWKKAYFIFLGTMLVDIDHLLADPIFDPNRCGIGFHPLHSYWAIGVYAIMLLPSKTRVIAIGLLFHMFTDWQDCLWMN